MCLKHSKSCTDFTFGSFFPGLPSRTSSRTLRTPDGLHFGALWLSILEVRSNFFGNFCSVDFVWILRRLLGPATRATHLCLGGVYSGLLDSPEENNRRGMTTVAILAQGNLARISVPRGCPRPNRTRVTPLGGFRLGGGGHTPWDKAVCFALHTFALVS